MLECNKISIFPGGLDFTLTSVLPCLGKWNTDVLIDCVTDFLFLLRVLLKDAFGIETLRGIETDE